MDDSVLNEAFALELVNYVVASKGLFWFSDTAVHHLNQDETTFDRKIGDAVVAILENNVANVYDCYSELYIKYHNYPKMAVGAYAFHIVPDYFPKGFSSEHFLKFCALIIGISLLFSEVGHQKIPDTAADVIATILRAFMFTGDFEKCGGFTELISVSDSVLEKLSKHSSSEL